MLMKIFSKRVWRLEGTPEIGDKFEIGGRVFEIVDVDDRTAKRTGRSYTMLTIEGRCCVCARRYTYSCTKTQINPLQTCERHRGKSRKRHLVP